MDEDQILQSIIADPQLTDPSIDTSGLRTTTPTRTELLANVPEFSGLKSYPNTPNTCLLYTSPSPRDGLLSRMPSSA